MVPFSDTYSKIQKLVIFWTFPNSEIISRVNVPGHKGQKRIPFRIVHIFSDEIWKYFEKLSVVQIWCVLLPGTVLGHCGEKSETMVDVHWSELCFSKKWRSPETFRNGLPLILDEPGYFLPCPISEFSESTLGFWIFLSFANFSHGKSVWKFQVPVSCT